eukprot:COSAG02_NODE_30938_length_542_cov_1.020316_1_plen_80_part_10
MNRFSWDMRSWYIWHPWLDSYELVPTIAEVEMAFGMRVCERDVRVRSVQCIQTRFKPATCASEGSNHPYTRLDANAAHPH